MANQGVVDNHSAVMDEILNMLTRRDLLYRVVSAPDRKLDLTVQLGGPDFPKESAQNPSEFAARVRAKLGDDKRLVRLYGTNTAIAYLADDNNRVRLIVLSHSRNRTQPGMRVRVNIPTVAAIEYGFCASSSGLFSFAALEVLDHLVDLAATHIAGGEDSGDTGHVIRVGGDITAGIESNAQLVGPLASRATQPPRYKAARGSRYH
jgi:hypothetical protein